MARIRKDATLTTRQHERLPTHGGQLGIIALVPDDWDSIVMSRHQLLSRIARRFPVAWVSPAQNWRAFFQPSGDFLHADKWTEPRPGLHVLKPGWIHPLIHRPEFLARLAMKSRLNAAARHLRKLGVDRIVLYLWRDEFAPAIDLIEHDFSCYHIDDEYSFGETEVPISQRERSLIERVDQVIVHSPALMAKKGGINSRTTMIPNGVDFAAYSTPVPIPRDLTGIRRPLIGYTGVIKRHLDLELLLRVARMRPNYSFVLVGPITFIDGKEEFLNELQQLPNVRLLGNRTPEELPAYVQHFDVCLMCYDVNGYTKYIYPLKLHEYLATGRPIVSSRIDAVMQTRPPIALASTLEEWLIALDASLLAEARTSAAESTRRDFARPNDWSTLANEIVGIFETRLAKAG